VSELERILAFVDGAKTGLDWMDSRDGGKVERNEYWRGFREALDAIGGCIDRIQSEAIEAKL
jgi:hypothetical protein